MPIYVQYCAQCTKQFDVFRKIADMAIPVECKFCGAETQRRIMAPMVRADYEPYISPTTGKLITGKREHIEDLKRSGCRIKEPGETQEFMRNKAAIHDRNIDYAVSEAMNKTFADMGIDADAHRIDTSDIPAQPMEAYERNAVP